MINIYTIIVNMLHSLYKTKLFSYYIPISGGIYFTSLLFYMAYKQDLKDKSTTINTINKFN
jgi:hypothetical protein